MSFLSQANEERFEDCVRFRSEAHRVQRVLQEQFEVLLDMFIYLFIFLDARLFDNCS